MGLVIPEQLPHAVKSVAAVVGAAVALARAGTGRGLALLRIFSREEAKVHNGAFCVWSSPPVNERSAVTLKRAGRKGGRRFGRFSFPKLDLDGNSPTAEKSATTVK